MGDRPLQRASLRATSVLLVITAALEVAFVVGLLVSRGVTNPIVNIGLELATQWVPVSIFWLVAVRTRFERWDVIFAALAVTLSALGDTYYSSGMDSHGFLASPSPADAGYLMFYPLMVAALVALFRGRLGGGAVLLETAIACVGAASVLTVILGPILQNAITAGDLLGSVVSVAYPVLDVLLVAALAGILVGAGIDAGPRSGALLLGLGLFAAADIVYALLVQSGTYVGGTALDACWAIGLALMAWWVDGVGRQFRPKAAPRARRQFGQVLPAVAVGAGLGVLLLGTQVTVPLLGLVLAALTVTLAAIPVILRQAVLSRSLASQERAVAQLKDLNQARSDMLVTVNHELRTPLTIINGYLELLLDGDAGELPGSASQMIKVVKDNSDRMRGLIADLLTVSHFEAKPSARRPELTDLERVATRVVGALQGQAEQRGVELRLGRRWANAMVDGDESQLERAVTNILDNALKFTAAGGRVTVSVEKAVSTDGSPQSVVRVVDTGIGIPAEDLPRLFDPFYRAGNVQSSASPGAGIGLAMARGIIESHRGSITAESELGEGTTVVIRLPSPAASTAPAARASAGSQR